MDERRDQPPEPEDGAEPIPAAGRLSPVQQAQQARATHASRCRQCADVDRPLCATGEQLWKDWTAALEEAYRQLHGKTA